MAALQTNKSASSYGLCKGAQMAVSDTFPAGLRVLVVDDDHTCLTILERMLRRCLYRVTTCSQASVALNLLRERKSSFDVVLSDVHMPDMDGYKLLEHIGLEMDLPVIMMSVDGRVCAVMRGIRHGACDYLIKPVREEELKNIWQHVVRRKFNENKELEYSGSFDDNDRRKRGDEVEYVSSVNEGTEGTVKVQKKRSCTKEDDDGELDNDDPSTSKKPRVVWSVELHQQFVSAVNQLGIEKAVPKRILELMNVPGLTRENVASHLQKFRLYLKRLSGMAQQGTMSGTFCGPGETNVKISSVGRFDIQSLAASGHIPPQTLAALHAELLGHPAGNLLTTVDQSALLQASLLGSKCVPAEHSAAFGQPLVKCQPNVVKQFPQPVLFINDSSNFGVRPSNSFSTVSPVGSHGGVNSQNSNMLMDALHKQQKLQQKQKQQLPQRLQQSTTSDPGRAINVQPSCLVVPSQALAGFQAGNSASVNQNCSLSRSAVLNYRLLSSHSNNTSVNAGQMSDGDGKSPGVLNGYSDPCSILPSTSSCSINAEKSMGQQVQRMTLKHGSSRQMPGLVRNAADMEGSFGATSNEVGGQRPVNLGFVGIPSRLAVEEFESPMDNLNGGNFPSDSGGIIVKQETRMKLMDNSKVGAPVLQQYTSSDLMGDFMD